MSWKCRNCGAEFQEVVAAIRHERREPGHVCEPPTYQNNEREILRNISYNLRHLDDDWNVAQMQFALRVIKDLADTTTVADEPRPESELPSSSGPTE